MNQPEETSCSENFNWQPVEENLYTMCLGLPLQFREWMMQLLTGDGIDLSHGWCKKHVKEEMERMDKEWAEMNV